MDWKNKERLRRLAERNACQNLRMKEARKLCGIGRPDDQVVHVNPGYPLILSKHNPKNVKVVGIKGRPALFDVWEIFGQNIRPKTVVSDSNKPLSSVNAYQHWLMKRGWKSLGGGSFTTVYGKDGVDKVIRVTRNLDNWIDYIIWADKKGYCGTFAPKVYSYKKHTSEHGDFAIALSERMVDTVAHQGWSNDFKLAETLIYPASRGSTMAKLFLEELAPGLSVFMDDLLDEFKTSTDLYGKNMMIRKDGTFCVTDPVCGGSRVSINRLRARDFTSLAALNYLGLLVKLFKVERTDNWSYDDYSDFVCVAPTAEAARWMHPDPHTYEYREDGLYFKYFNKTAEKVDNKHWGHGGWVKDLKDVKVIELGEAISDKAEVVCTSFHAG